MLPETTLRCMLFGHETKTFTYRSLGVDIDYDTLETNVYTATIEETSCKRVGCFHKKTDVLEKDEK